eukprot:IDg12996t1
MEAEKFSLIAVEWNRQVYANYKLWRLSSWCFDQITKIASSIYKILGYRRNTEDLVDLVRALGRTAFSHDNVCFLNVLAGSALLWQKACDIAPLLFHSLPTTSSVGEKKATKPSSALLVDGSPELVSPNVIAPAVESPLVLSS